MSDHESFEDRLRAMAEQVSQSVRRMSEVDLDEFAERYGVDPDRARAFADLAGQWLSDRVAGGEPFGHESRPRDADRPASPMPDPHLAYEPTEPPPQASGPDPLDLPTGPQGRALSALDSRRWTVRSGSDQLVGTGEGPPPSEVSDLVGELRARDWITADGALTLTGRHALGRWCRTAEDPTRLPPEADAAPQ